MPTLLEIWLRGAAGVVVAVTLVWLVSLWRRDASVVDVFWGLGFVGLAWWYRIAGPDPASLGQWLLVAAVTAWGLRLAAHIGWRQRGAPEDRRYAAMREEHGETFRWRSLVTVFWLQGALVALFSLPFLLVEAQPAPGPVVPIVLGAVLWIVGFLFETVADAQMARFKADPANRGQVLDSGLWRYSRHPNYFGEALLWWGYGVWALGSPGGAWALLVAAAMTFLLVRVSGIPLAEKGMESRREGAAAYLRRTSAFVPMPPGEKGPGPRGLW